jgi:hypothetical protein
LNGQPRPIQAPDIFQKENQSMLFLRKLAFTFCAISALLFGAGNSVQAAPAARLTQAAVAATAARSSAMPPIEKAYYHHRYYRHHGYGWHHHGYGWHHGGHWRHPYWRHHHRYYW